MRMDEARRKQLQRERSQHHAILLAVVDEFITARPEHDVYGLTISPMAVIKVCAQRGIPGQHVTGDEVLGMIHRRMILRGFRPDPDAPEQPGDNFEKWVK